MENSDMWVRFLEDYDHQPRAGVIISYLAGEAYSVTHDCGEAAIAVGKAVKIATPKKGEAPQKMEVKKNGDNIKNNGSSQSAKTV